VGISESALRSKFGTDFNNSINTSADLGSIRVVKSSSVRGVFAIKVSGCVPERFSSARRFCPPQVVKGGAVFRITKNKRQPQERLPLFFLTAARTQYGLSMAGANGLESLIVAMCLRPASKRHYSDFVLFCKPRGFQTE